ncbi:MAG: o-succinylbenzoate synthase, partial [Bacteroidota bacterium]
FFESPILQGAPVPVNGLVWMSDAAGMKRQAREKAEEGYTCIKFKVGGLSFEEELGVLDWVRGQVWGKDLTIRLDANGAFGVNDVFTRLEQLSAFGIHSIEQPIRAGQPELMKEVCSGSPIPVALDEELIGVQGAARIQLIESIRPAWLVIKPSLHGGFSGAMEWIQVAGQCGAGWWITSSLESPLGLGALAQFTSACQPIVPQGLGTGRIYSDAPSGATVVRSGYLYLA